MFGGFHFSELEYLKIDVHDDFFEVHVAGRAVFKFETVIKFELLDARINADEQIIKLKRLEHSRFGGKSYFRLLAIVVRLVLSVFGQDLADIMLKHESPVNVENDVYTIDLSKTAINGLLKKDILGVPLAAIYKVDKIICEEGKFKIVSSINLEEVSFGSKSEKDSSPEKSKPDSEESDTSSNQ
ncbi:MAG: hypothetical protein ACLFN5_07555 [bacterium]